MSDLNQPPYPPSDGNQAGRPAPARIQDRLLVGFVSVVAGAGLVCAGIFAGLLGASVAHGHVNVHAPVTGSVRQAPAGKTTQAGKGPLQVTGSAPSALDQAAIVDIDTVVQGVTSNGQAAGTGMIVSSDGDIVTNNHVIQGAIKISVVVRGTGTYTATVVGADPAHDVAVIHIPAGAALPTVSFGDSAQLRVGDAVTAIGNALGRGGAPTITQGSVTALGQSITASDGPGTPAENLYNMVQTDADIQPGDSGGALVSKNQVIGMITAGSSSGGGRYRGTRSTVGFAIPSSDVVGEINLIRSGRGGSSVIMGIPGFLGISVSDNTGQRGAVIGTVIPGSPAERAGLHQGDVITQIAGQAIASAADVGTAIHAHKPGEAIDITWSNAAGTHHGRAVLISGPAA